MKEYGRRLREDYEGFLSSVVNPGSDRKREDSIREVGRTLFYDVWLVFEGGPPTLFHPPKKLFLFNPPLFSSRFLLGLPPRAGARIPGVLLFLRRIVNSRKGHVPAKGELSFYRDFTGLLKQMTRNV